MERVKKVLAVILVWLTVTLPAGAGNAQIKYIEKYAPMAVEQMRKYGVPASITLAQGLLESDAGRSMLAVEANNHFGIKCHSGWTGRSVSMDDDRAGECFRSYKNASSSFEDHSKFLVDGSRYAFLFKLRKDDYKGWAKGLKKAGYATDPNYASKLIEIVERYGLYKYDKRGGSRKRAVEQHQTYISNGLLYVRLGEGETLRQISNEFQKEKYLIRRFNEIDRKYKPEVGSVIYLEKKKARAAKGHETHTVMEGETLWSIAQMYGVKMKSIIKRNNLGETNPLRVGMRLDLR